MWPCIVSQSLLLILTPFLLSLILWQCKDGHCRKFLLYMYFMPNGDGQVARRCLYESAQSSGVRHNTLKKAESKYTLNCMLIEEKPASVLIKVVKDF